MDAYLVELLGMVAGTLTTAAFIPQVYQIFKTRNVASISPVYVCNFYRWRWPVANLRPDQRSGLADHGQWYYLCSGGYHFGNENTD